MGLQNFIGRENVYELYFITCKEAQSKQIFPFYICIDKCGPRGVLTKYVALLWNEDCQPWLTDSSLSSLTSPHT